MPRQKTSRERAHSAQIKAQEDAPPEAGGLTAVYHADWQGKKVMGMLWFSIAVCLGCLYWAYDLSRTYGLSPGDGGVLRPLGERLGWAGVVAAFGLTFAVGMIAYARKYIHGVWLDGSAQQIRFETLRLWGAARFSVPPGDVVGSRYQAGQFATPSHTVNTPFYFVYIRGHRLPYILDGQGKFIRPGLAAQLLDLR